MSRLIIYFILVQMQSKKKPLHVPPSPTKKNLSIVDSSEQDSSQPEILPNSFVLTGTSIPSNVVKRDKVQVRVSDLLMQKSNSKRELSPYTLINQKSTKSILSSQINVQDQSEISFKEAMPQITNLRMRSKKEAFDSSGEATLVKTFDMPVNSAKAKKELLQIITSNTSRENSKLNSPSDSMPQEKRNQLNNSLLNGFKMGLSSFQKSQKSLEEMKENIMLSREQQTASNLNLPWLKRKTDLNVASSARFQSVTQNSSHGNTFDQIDETENNHITRIAEKIRKLPEVENAWMRRRNEERALHRRHRSVAQPEKIDLPQTSETFINLSDFGTANPPLIRKGVSQHPKLATDHSLPSLKGSARTAELLQMQRGQTTINRQETGGTRKNNSIEETLDESSKNMSDLRHAEKWKEYLSVKKKPEVFSHNIFSDDQKSQAKDIYQRRFDAFAAVRQGIESQLQGNSVLHKGKVHQMLLKENSSLFIKKRKFQHGLNAQTLPVPNILSRSRSPTQTNLSNAASEIESLKSFIKKKQSVQLNLLPAVSSTIINTSLPQTTLAGIKNKQMVESSQFIDNSHLQIYENLQKRQKSPFFNKQTNQPTELSCYSSSQTLKQHVRSQNESEAKHEIQQRIAQMNEYLNGIKKEISMSTKCLQKELAIHQFKADQKKLSFLPKDFYERSPLSAASSTKIIEMSPKHSPFNQSFNHRTFNEHSLHSQHSSEKELLNEEQEEAKQAEIEAKLMEKERQLQMLKEQTRKVPDGVCGSEKLKQTLLQQLETFMMSSEIDEDQLANLESQRLIHSIGSSVITLSPDSQQFKDLYTGKSPEEIYMQDIQSLLNSMPTTLNQSSATSIDVQSEMEGDWTKFKEIFIKLVKNLAFRKVRKGFPNKLRSDHFKYENQINKFEFSDQVLKKHFAGQNGDDKVILALSHMQNDRERFKPLQTREYTNLLHYIEKFADLSGEETGQLLKDLFEKLSLIQVGGTTQKKKQVEQKAESSLSKISYPKEVIDGVEYGQHSSEESDNGKKKKKPKQLKQQQLTIFEQRLQQKEQKVGEGTEQAMFKLLQKIEFLEVMKKSGVKSDRTLPLNNPKVEFCKGMNKSRQLAIPILDGKSQEINKLEIVNKNVAESNLKVLINSIQYINKLQVLVLVNTNISDAFFAKLLQAIHTNSQWLKSITYRGSNQLGNTSITELKFILKKGLPYQLEELKIEQVKMHSESPNVLIDAIIEQSSLLRLSLVELPITVKGLKSIAPFITKSHSLIDLCLSSLHLPAVAFLHLLQAICINTKLQYLDISGNQLIDQFTQKYPENELNVRVKPTAFKREKTNLQLKEEAESSNSEEELVESLGGEEISDDDDYGSPSLIGRQSSISIRKSANLMFKQATEENILSLIEHFFTKNKGLIHCNLAHTGFTRQMVDKIVKLLNDNPDGVKNLRGLHLTINEPKFDKAWIRKIKTSFNQKINESDHDNDIIQTVRHQLNTQFTQIEELPEEWSSGDDQAQNQPLQASIEIFPTKNTAKTSVFKSVKEMISTKTSKGSTEIALGRPKVKIQDINYATLQRKQKDDTQVVDDTHGVFYSMQTLCFNRILGHTEDMRHNADLITINQWSLEIGTPQGCCWVCQKPIYTLFFIELEGDEVDKANDIELQFYQQSIPLYKGDSGEKGDIQQKVDMIKVQDLCLELDIKNFEKIDFLQMLIDAKCCKQETTDFSSLKKREQNRYLQLVDSYKYQEYKKGWPKVLTKFMDYKDIQIIGQYSLDNGPNSVTAIELKEENQDDDDSSLRTPLYQDEHEVQEFFEKWAPKTPVRFQKQLMICALFIKPGKHQYRFVDKRSGLWLGSSGDFHTSRNNSASKLTSFVTKPLSFFSKTRTERIPFAINSKLRQELFKVRFYKMESVFQDWKDDEPGCPKMMFDNDQKNWGVSRIVKMDQDIRQIKLAINNHLLTLINLFIELASSDQSYPKISFTTFVALCKRTKMYAEEQKMLKAFSTSINRKQSTMTLKDPPVLSLLDISNEFAQTTLTPEKLVRFEQVPANITLHSEKVKWVSQRQLEEIQQSRLGLDRSQFFEMLIRCGIHKYFNTRNDPSIGTAIKRLIEEDLINYVRVEPIQKFRTEKLWTNGVNIMLQANLKQLQKAFESFFDEEKKVLTQKIALRTILEKMFGINEKDSRKIFARSKMFVINEKTGSDMYLRLKFIEFLEMLGRITEHLYSQDSGSKLSFEEQLALVIDEVLAKVQLPREIPALKEDILLEVELDS